MFLYRVQEEIHISSAPAQDYCLISPGRKLVRTSAQHIAMVRQCAASISIPRGLLFFIFCTRAGSRDEREQEV